jgi:hypothetical protein
MLMPDLIDPPFESKRLSKNGFCSFALSDDLDLPPSNETIRLESPCSLLRLSTARPFGTSPYRGTTTTNATGLGLGRAASSSFVPQYRPPMLTTSESVDWITNRQ